MILFFHIQKKINEKNERIEANISSNKPVRHQLDGAGMRAQNQLYGCQKSPPEKPVDTSLPLAFKVPKL